MLSGSAARLGSARLTSVIGSHLCAVTLSCSNMRSLMNLMLLSTNSDTPKISHVRHKPVKQHNVVQHQTRTTLVMHLLVEKAK